MKPMKVQGQPSVFLWTPKGEVFLGEFEHLTGFEPRFLGTFYTPSSELSQLHEVEYRPPRFPKDRLRRGNVDQACLGSHVSSHC